MRHTPFISTPTIPPEGWTMEEEQLYLEMTGAAGSCSSGGPAPRATGAARTTEHLRENR